MSIKTRTKVPAKNVSDAFKESFEEVARSYVKQRESVGKTKKYEHPIMSCPPRSLCHRSNEELLSIEAKRIITVLNVTLDKRETLSRWIKSIFDTFHNMWYGLLSYYIFLIEEDRSDEDIITDEGIDFAFMVIERFGGSVSREVGVLKCGLKEYFDI